MTLVNHLRKRRAASGRLHLILCLPRPIFHTRAYTHFAHMTRGDFGRWMAGYFVHSISKISGSRLLQDGHCAEDFLFLKYVYDVLKRLIFSKGLRT